MKPNVILLVIAGSLFSSAAVAQAPLIETVNAETVSKYVQDAYPHVASFDNVQDPETLIGRVRAFSSHEAMIKYFTQISNDGTILKAYGEDGSTYSDIVSKISVYGPKDRKWRAEFVAREKAKTSKGESVTCKSVTLMMSEMPLMPGMNAVGIDEVLSKPSKVKCPAN